MQQAAPVAEPAEGALHEPAPLQHDEALLIWVLLNNAVAHAVQMAPLGGESAVEKGQAQVGPRRLAVIKGRQGVAVLNVGGHDSQCQDVAFCTDQRHALAPNQLHGPVVATRPAHPEASDVARVDDGKAGRRTAAATATLSARQSAHQALEQPLLDPAPEPDVDRARGRKAGWQRPPSAADPPGPTSAEPLDAADPAETQAAKPAVHREGAGQPQKPVGLKSGEPVTSPDFACHHSATGSPRISRWCCERGRKSSLPFGWATATGDCTYCHGRAVS